MRAYRKPDILRPGIRDLHHLVYRPGSTLDTIQGVFGSRKGTMPQRRSMQVRVLRIAVAGKVNWEWKATYTGPRC